MQRTTRCCISWKDADTLPRQIKTMSILCPLVTGGANAVLTSFTDTSINIGVTQPKHLLFRVRDPATCRRGFFLRGNRSLLVHRFIDKGTYYLASESSNAPNFFHRWITACLLGNMRRVVVQDYQFARKNHLLSVRARNGCGCGNAEFCETLSV